MNFLVNGEHYKGGALVPTTVLHEYVEMKMGIRKPGKRLTMNHSQKCLFSLDDNTDWGTTISSVTALTMPMAILPTAMEQLTWVRNLAGHVYS